MFCLTDLFFRGLIDYIPCVCVCVCVCVHMLNQRKKHKHGLDAICLYSAVNNTCNVYGLQITVPVGWAVDTNLQCAVFR